MNESVISYILYSVATLLVFLRLGLRTRFKAFSRVQEAFVFGILFVDFTTSDSAPNWGPALAATVIALYSVLSMKGDDRMARELELLQSQRRD